MGKSAKKSAAKSAAKSTAKTTRKAAKKGGWKRAVTVPLAFLRGPIDKWKAKKAKKPTLVSDKKKKKAKKPRKAGEVTTGQKVFRVARAVFLALLICAAIFMFFETSLIFAGTRFPHGHWAELDRVEKLEEITLATDDGVNLHALWLPVADGVEPRATVLFFHGNAGNLSHRVWWLDWLRRQRCNVFAIDYRGYGKSDGSPNESGVYRDGRAGYDWLTQHGIAADEIILFGRSLGAAVATELAVDPQRPAGGLILEAPFISVPEMSKQVMPYFPVRWLMATRMDNMDKVPRIPMPLLVNHAVHDELIPVAHGRAVFAAAHTGHPEAQRPHKEMYEMPEGGHNELVWERAEYQRRFLQFVDLARSPK